MLAEYRETMGRMPTSREEARYPFVNVSSKFSRTFDTTVHAASSDTSTDVGGGDKPLVASSLAATGSFRKCFSCC